MAGRVALIVVGAMVNDEGGAVSVEESALAIDGDEAVQYFDDELSAFGDVHIRHVAGMRPFAVQNAVLGFVGVVMAAGRFEIGALAFPGFMNVEAVLAGGDAIEGQLDEDAV